MRHLRTYALTAVVTGALAGLCSPTLAHDKVGPSGLRVAARIAGPDGGWDYASYDAARRKIYVAHGDAVMAIDADTGAVSAHFAAGARLHAVVPIPGSARLVTTNSGDSSAKILDAASGALIASVTTAKDPDGATFDPSTGLVVVVNGDAGQVSLVDPSAAKVVDTITVGSGLEYPAADGKGRLYVNIEETNQIAVIDIAARKVLARYALGDCHAPTGLALTADQRLISACANGVAKILDAASGKELASFTIGPRPDAVLLDETRGFAYIPSGGDGTLAVIALKGAAANTIIDTVATQKGARTGTVDLKTGKIYLPTTTYLPPAAPGQKAAAKPGSFQVLVLDRG